MKKKKLEKNYHQKISDSILNNNFKIGCMQGRLLPKYRNRFQAFPLNNWEKEFKLASNLNLDFIEFIFDKGKILDSPIFT